VVEADTAFRLRANKLVEVASVEVESNAVKFWRVVEELTKRLPKIADCEKRLVEEATEEKKLVVVAFPETKRSPSTESLAEGEVVPIPKKPLAVMVRADLVEVAPVAVVEVAR
jgi:hypothetical protein